jgi:hypothetical protein
LASVPRRRLPRRGTTDEDEPQAADSTSRDELEDPQRDAQEAEHAPGLRCLHGCPLPVAAPPPQNRPQYSAAVQRRPRQQVEHRENEVDDTQPGQHRRANGGVAGQARLRGHCGQSQEQQSQRDANRGPDRSDSEFSAWVVSLPLKPGHTAEHPQRDAIYPHIVALRDQRVRHLVREQREEEHKAGDQRRENPPTLLHLWLLKWEPRARQRPHHQSEDDEHAPVQADSDPADSPQPYVLFHCAARAVDLSEGVRSSRRRVWMSHPGFRAVPVPWPFGLGRGRLRHGKTQQVLRRSASSGDRRGARA